jgi:hypothetical protein
MASSLSPAFYLSMGFSTKAAAVHFFSQDPETQKFENQLVKQREIFYKNRGIRISSDDRIKAMVSCAEESRKMKEIREEVRTAVIEEQKK